MTNRDPSPGETGQTERASVMLKETADNCRSAALIWPEVRKILDRAACDLEAAASIIYHNIEAKALQSITPATGPSGDEAELQKTIEQLQFMVDKDRELVAGLDLEIKDTIFKTSIDTLESAIRYLHHLSAPGRETWRHKKRGTLYTVLGDAEVQTSHEIEEGHKLTIYRGEDGKLWARPTDEFHDGRFEPCGREGEKT